MQNNNPSNTPAENKMGVQPVGRLLAGMAVPMMISMLVQALYNVVDSIFVSRLSENALTAVSLAFPLQNLMIAVCAGTTVGMNALLSRSLGAKEQDKADQAANTGIFLALCSFVLFCVIGVFFSRTFFQLQTDVTEIVSSGTIYAQICLGCSIGIFCQFTFERLLQSTGRTHLSMCTQLLGALTNIILDPILIFGLFGAPRLGVAGAAVATVTGQCVAAVAALIMNLKCNPDIHIVPRKIRFHGPTVKNIYRIGFPSIVMQCIGSVMVFGVNTNPHLLHHHRHRCVWRLLQAPELYLHAGLRTEQRHGAHCRLQLRGQEARPGKENHQTGHFLRGGYYGRGPGRL